MQIESIDVSPNPPKPGEDLTVTVKGEVTERIEVNRLPIITQEHILTPFLGGRDRGCYSENRLNQASY
jgi:hypothetical protein